MFGCLCSPSIPQPDTCNNPSTTGVETLEMGAGVEGAFRPFDAGEKLSVVLGGQGASMLTFRLRVGPKAPECIDQSLSVNSAFDHETLASVTVPAATYTESGGIRATKTMYLIGSRFSFPPRVQVVAKVGKVVSSTRGSRFRRESR